MTQEWYEEYVFEVVVDKCIVPKEVLDVCIRSSPSYIASMGR